MAAFFLWCILFVICWPLALLALILYPLVWLILLPSGWLGSRYMARWNSSGPQ